MRCLLAVPFLFCFGCTPGPRIDATTAHRVHPVLIRNEHQPILQLTLQVTGAQPVRVTSVTCTLNGSDDPADVESVQLFYTGTGQTFSAEKAFGSPASPTASVSFSGDQSLTEGANNFWLAGTLKASANLSHKVGGECTSVATTAGTVTPRAQNPGARHRIGVALRKHNDDNVHTYRIPSLTDSAKGTLLSVYDMRRRKSRDLQEDIDIGLSRSTDGGQTWEAPRVIMDMGEYNGLPQEQNGVSDPGIIVDRKTGEIFTFAVWMWGKPGKHQWNEDGSEPGFEIGKSAQLLMVRSRDDGLTWTKPENLTRKLKKAEWWLLAPAPQSGINLTDGTLVMPVQGRDKSGVPFATIMVSRDHGASWTVGEPAFSGGNECQAAQLSDGSIMLNMRNDHERYRAVYVTRDLGRTWQPHETNRKTLIEPNCNASLYRFDRGGDGALLLFANPHSQKKRTHQTVQVSFDDGRSWPEQNHLLLDEGQGRGYPSMTRVDPGHVGIVYEGSQADLAFEKIALAELLKK